MFQLTSLTLENQPHVSQKTFHRKKKLSRNHKTPCSQPSSPVSRQNVFTSKFSRQNVISGSRTTWRSCPCTFCTRPSWNRQSRGRWWGRGRWASSTGWTTPPGGGVDGGGVSSAGWGRRGTAWWRGWWRSCGFGGGRRTGPRSGTPCSASAPLSSPETWFSLLKWLKFHGLLE